MHILLIGADSQCGEALLTQLTQQGIGLTTLSTEEALQGSLAELQAQYRDHLPTCVVNIHHLEGFDPGQFTQKELEQHHVHLPQQAAKLAEAFDVPLVHLSDYQVFSGNKDKPYTEADEPHSQTLYGVTRWQGELSVQRYCQQFIILRVGTLFCEQGHNVLTTLLERWQHNKALALSTLLQFSPTPAADIARVIYAILQQLACGAKPWGLYHYCSADTATPYDFAEVLLAAYQQYHPRPPAIQLSAIQEALPKSRKKSTSPNPPINTVMACQKILNTFGIRQRPWRGELTRIVKHMYQESPHEQNTTP